MTIAKTFTFILGTWYLVLGTMSFAECNSNAKTPGYDEYSEGKYSYECNVKNICLGKKFGGSGWNFDTSKQLIKTHDKNKYPDLSKKSKTFNEIRTLYRETQDSIFECALLKSKYATHSQILKDYDPAKRSKEYLTKLNESIKSQLKEKKCLSADDADKVYNYKDLQDSTSYEECVYNMYLYYYEKKAGDSIGMLLGEQSGYKKSIDIAGEVESTKTLLENEYALSNESLDNALSGYGNFHKYYTPHVMLQMTYMELGQEKNLVAQIIHGIEQLISLFTGAQKSKQ